MKKIVGIILGLLIISVSAGIAWMLYKNFGSTLIVILNIIIVMVGILMGITVYLGVNATLSQANKKTNTAHYPELETGKILVRPLKFIENIEKLRGDLFLATTSKVNQNITLRKGEYDKLTDELAFYFSDGIKAKMRGVKEISIGNHQFLVYHFEEMLFFDGKESVHLIKEGKTITEKKNKETKEHRFSSSTPLFIFNWEEQE